MSYQAICLVFFALFALWLFNEQFQNPGRICPLCGGQKDHGRNCPQRDRDED